MAINANPVRGTRDFLPKEMRLREAMQSIILDVYKSAGFQRIQTPILEDIERLNKSDGGENLSLIFPEARKNTYGSTMCRLNDADLFMRVFNRRVLTVEDAFAITSRPLNLNEFA